MKRVCPICSGEFPRLVAGVCHVQVMPVGGRRAMQDDYICERCFVWYCDVLDLLFAPERDMRFLIEPKFF